MVLLCGVPNDAPLYLLTDALEEAGYPYVLVNQREFAQMTIHYELVDGVVLGELRIGRLGYSLSDITGVYNRAMNCEALPEFNRLAPDDPLRGHAILCHEGLF